LVSRVRVSRLAASCCCSSCRPADLPPGGFAPVSAISLTTSPVTRWDARLLATPPRTRARAPRSTLHVHRQGEVVRRDPCAAHDMSYGPPAWLWGWTCAQRDRAAYDVRTSSVGVRNPDVRVWSSGTRVRRRRDECCYRHRYLAKSAHVATMVRLACENSFR